MPRRKRCNWAFWGVILVLSVAAAGYVVVLPVAAAVVESQAAGTAEPLLWTLIAIERVRRAALNLAIFAWLFALGAAIGSFLNVVVYRMPKGLPITGLSHCPSCKATIAFYDNIPVFAWLILRGRCRKCRQRISPRYPIVELLAGLLFVGLALVELRSGGANVPDRPRPPSGGFDLIIGLPPWDLIGLYGYHCWLLVVLLGLGLIKLDGHRLPRKLVVFAGAVGLALPAVWPVLQPVPWTAGWPGGLPGLGTGAIGLVAGAALGAALERIWSCRRRAGPAQTARPAGAAVGLALVGMHLGWQATVSAAWIASVFQLAANLLGRVCRLDRRVPWLMHLFAAALVQICLWSFLWRRWWWPGSSVSPLVLGTACVAILCVGWLAGQLSRRAT